MLEDKYKFKLARFLLNYDPSWGRDELDADDLQHPVQLYSDEELAFAITNTIQKLKPKHKSVLTGYNVYMHQHADVHKAREDKHFLLEHHHVHDTELLNTLKGFLVMAIALLVKVERLHKKHILCGEINPYTFLYSHKMRLCEPVDLGKLMADQNMVKAEEGAFGDQIYAIYDLKNVKYSKYLAPELRESVRQYHLLKKLNNYAREAVNRDSSHELQQQVKSVLHEFHQRKLKYTNKSEIYSIGYTFNQIFSHAISKLVYYDLRMGEQLHGKADPKVIREAELLLPDSFANPEDERILGLVNEAIVYIHDLMQEHIERRDSLELSIEKFMSLLKRSSITKPDDLLEEEEHAGHEHVENLHESEHDEHKHAEHAHEEHDHTHEHESHDHAAHEHAEHEHEEHEHAEHEHAEHEHEEHEHAEHEHAEHEHAEHEHAEHEHAEHEHGEHEHAEHEHEEHEHEEHEHGEHEHAEHEHEDHEHAEHEHEEHEHAEHEHEEHGHEQHEHSEHEHAGHDAHSSDHADTDNHDSADHDNEHAPDSNRNKPSAGKH